MRLTIVCDDNLVIIDGVRHSVDCSAYPTIHAVQWYGSHGQIEFKADDLGNRAPNERIDELSQFQPLIDAWQDIEDHPLASAIDASAIINQSYRASLRREAEALQQQGKTYEAVKLLLKASNL